MIVVYALVNIVNLSGDYTFVVPPSTGRREMVMAAPATAALLGADLARAAEAAKPAAAPAKKPSKDKVVKANGFTFTIPEAAGLTEFNLGKENFYQYYKTDSAFVKVGPYSKDLYNTLVNQYATPTLTGGPSIRVVKAEKGETMDDLEIVRLPKGSKLTTFASVSFEFPPGLGRNSVHSTRAKNSEHVYVRNLKGPNGGATMVIKLDEEVDPEVAPIYKYPEVPKQTVKAKAILDSFKLV